MEIVNIHQAKTHLSRFLERVASGEEIIIAKNGEPVAKLVPMPRSPRQPGRLKGKLVIGADFDKPLPKAIRKAFRGEGE